MAAVPTCGRSAAALRADMIAHPGLHGSLFALRGSFVERIARAGLRLPVGLYRGDGLLGAFVMHDLDPLRTPWTPSRVAVEPGATWTTRPLRPWVPGDLARHARRLVRQGRGRLESRAIRHAIARGGFAALPESADRLILDWVAADPDGARSILRDPLAALALREARRATAPDPASLLPRLVARVGA